METLSLQLKERTKTGKAVNHLRKEGLIPAVVYGHGVTPKIVSVEYNPFIKVYRLAGESSLVDLTIDNKEAVKALIQDIAIDPMTDRLIHVDFRQVSMKEKLKAKIPVVFAGESRAVKELGGILVKSLAEIEVECLPQYLVHEISVDLSPIKEFGETIRVGSVSAPEGMVFLTGANEVIATVTPPRSEEELKSLEEKIEENVEAVEVTKVKKEAEEGEALSEGEKKEEKKKEEKK